MDQGDLGGMVRLRRTVAEAFVTDPLVVWVFPDEASRLDAAAAWIGRYIEGYVAGGRVDTIEEDHALVAAALWRFPGDETRIEGPPSVSGLLAALVGSRFAELRAAFREMASVEPEQPHAYLHFLAVAPAHQGRGLGTRVIRPGLEAAADAGIGAHLETTNPDNLPFYRRLGFQVTGELRLGAGGPHLWAMWCEPAARPRRV